MRQVVAGRAKSQTSGSFHGGVLNEIRCSTAARSSSSQQLTQPTLGGVAMGLAVHAHQAGSCVARVFGARLETLSAAATIGDATQGRSAGRLQSLSPGFDLR